MTVGRPRASIKHDNVTLTSVTFRFAINPFFELYGGGLAFGRVCLQFRFQRPSDHPGSNVGVLDVATKKLTSFMSPRNRSSDLEQLLSTLNVREKIWTVINSRNFIHRVIWGVTFKQLHFTSKYSNKNCNGKNSGVCTYYFYQLCTYDTLQKAE